MENKTNKILEAIRVMTKQGDFTDIDRIEINFIDGGIDVNIEETQQPEDVPSSDLYGLLHGDMELKSSAIVLMMSDYRDVLVDFLKPTYKLLRDNERWAEVLNMLFKDIALKNDKDYYFQVIKR